MYAGFCWRLRLRLTWWCGCWQVVGDTSVCARLLYTECTLLCTECKLLCVSPCAWCARWLHALHHLLHGLDTAVNEAAGNTLHLQTQRMLQAASTHQHAASGTATGNCTWPMLCAPITCVSCCIRHRNCTNASAGQPQHVSPAASDMAT